MKGHEIHRYLSRFVTPISPFRAPSARPFSNQVFVKLIYTTATVLTNAWGVRWVSRRRQNNCDNASWGQTSPVPSELSRNPRRQRLERQSADAGSVPGIKPVLTAFNYSEAASNSPIQDLFRVCEQPNTNPAGGGCRNHDGRSPAGFLLGRRGGLREG